MKTIGFDVRLTYYRQGGIASYMRQLAVALSDLAMPYQVKMLHNFRATEQLTPAPNFKRINCYTPCHHRFEDMILGTELLPHRLDILHSPDFIPPRWGAKRYVITVHDLAFLLFANIQTADSLRYYAGQIQRAVTQVDRIIAVSEATKADMVNLLDVDAEKIHVIWEGVHEQFQPTPNRFPNMPDEYILFVGTIEPRKNIPNMLKGYAIAKSRLGKIPKLVLAGQTGWLAQESFETIDTLGLRDDVILLDTFTYQDLPSLYTHAIFHVLVSQYEGFGFPPLEAMACGTPTLISDRGALREVAGEAALYADPDSPESIADGMQRYLDDQSLRDAMRQKGTQQVKQFTWHKAAQQTYSVYEELLS